MARPERSGLEYYPRDVRLHNDRKFRRVRLKHGYTAVAVYELLLDMIYSDKGYYLPYGEKDREDVLWELLSALQGPGQPEEKKLMEIIDDLTAADLFDGGMKKRGLLTSRRIQVTYYKATLERKNVVVDTDIWLLSMDEMRELSGRSSILRFFVNRPINPVNQPNNPENRSCGTQSKVKESKVNKSNNMPGAAQNAAPDRQNIFIELPLNDGTLWPVTAEEITHWKDLYRAVDVEAEVRKMRGWLDANPKNRKTAAGVLRYVTRWLGKAQDQARAVPASPAPRTGLGYKELT